MVTFFAGIVKAGSLGHPEALANVLCETLGVSEKTLGPAVVRKVLHDLGIGHQRLTLQYAGALLVKETIREIDVSMVTHADLAELEESFACAHMLGHLLFEIQPKIVGGKKIASGYMERESPFVRFMGSSESVPARTLEEKADVFAAALLLPRKHVRVVLAEDRNLEHVARRFGISSAFLEKRVRCLVVNSKSSSRRSLPEDKMSSVGDSHQAPEFMHRIRDIARKMTKDAK